jgi:hypothetical protein
MLTVLIGAPAHGEALSRKALKGSAELLRGRMQECAAAEVRKLSGSGQGAAILADAAMTICRQAVDDAVEGGVRLRRVELRRGMSPAEEREYRVALGRSLRDAVVSDAVAVRASDERRREEATQAVAKFAAQPVEGLKKAVTRCLEVFAVKMDREGDDAVEPVTEMCRPEIEALARGAFLADNSIGLQTAREEALSFAIQTAAKRFGGKGT